MKRLNVLIVTPWYPTRDNRVIGVFVREHAKAAQLHHEVVVLHCGVSSQRLRHLWDLQREHDEDLTHQIPTYHVQYRELPLRAASHAAYIWSVFRAYNRLMRRHGRFDLIHAHTFCAGLAAVLVGKRWRIPVVISEHHSAFLFRSLSRTAIIKARLAFRLANMVLPVSRALQRAIERYHVQARFRVVPNVIDTELFAPDLDRRYDAATTRLLFAGTLIDQKGLAYLLRAVGQLPYDRRDWHLDVVGDGAEKEKYRQMTAQLGLSDKVVFHGWKLKSEVARLMRRADLFIVPSLAETFSIVTAEALATGTPVVATRCGGPEEFVTEDSGMLVPPGDTPALAAAVTTMLDRLPCYDRAAIADHVKEKYGYAAVGKMLQDVYSEVTRPAERTR